MSRARSKARRGALQALYQWQLSGGADSLASEEAEMFRAERRGLTDALPD
jgi:transcription termination factor NusB